MIEESDLTDVSALPPNTLRLFLYMLLTRHSQATEQAGGRKLAYIPRVAVLVTFVSQRSPTLMQADDRLHIHILHEELFVSSGFQFFVSPWDTLFRYCMKKFAAYYEKKVS